MQPRQRAWALTAIAASVLALFVSPFLAAAYLATEEGADEPPTLPWVEPFRALVGGALTFSDADGVYTAYGRMSWTMGVAILAAAVVLHQRQAPAGGRVERWGFWALAGGAALGTLGTLVIFFIILSDAVFLGLLVPGMLLMIIGAIVFGVGTLRARVAPAGIAWLLIAGGPLQLVLSTVLGHNMIAFAPVLVASLWAGVWGLRAGAAGA